VLHQPGISSFDDRSSSMISCTDRQVKQPGLLGTNQAEKLIKSNAVVY